MYSVPITASVLKKKKTWHLNIAHRHDRHYYYFFIWILSVYIKQLVHWELRKDCVLIVEVCTSCTPSATYFTMKFVFKIVCLALKNHKAKLCRLGSLLMNDNICCTLSIQRKPKYSMEQVEHGLKMTVPGHRTKGLKITASIFKSLLLFPL